jgi:hypothetical protein
VSAAVILIWLNVVEIAIETLRAMCPDPRI